MAEVPSFEIIGETPWEELEEMVRATPLLNQPDTRPYADATISIERFRLSELASTTRYIEAGLLGAQRALREALLPQGHDQLDLDRRLILDSGNGTTVRLMPPLVERYEPEGMVPYILDGAHRAHLSRLVSDDDDPFIACVFVRDGITAPPYALPNPWGEVEVVETRPEDKSTWKNYRDFAHRYDLYRDYNHVIDSAPRGLDGQT